MFPEGFEAQSGNSLMRDVTNLNVTLSGKYLTMVNGSFEFHGREEIVIPAEIECNIIFYFKILNFDCHFFLYQ